MGDTAVLAIALPETESAVRKALDAERRKLQAWAAGVIRDIEDQRDHGLRRLDQVASALTEEGKAMPGKASPAKSRRRRSGRGRPTVAALAEKRRQAIHRFLVEQDRPLALAEIRRLLRLSEFSTRSALKRLILEGMVIRTGTGSGTRYQAKPDAASALAVDVGPPHNPLEGTLQGRLLATLEDRGSASLEELAQAVRTPREEVERECGGLIREEEIRMARRNGRPVYVHQQAA